MKRTVRTQGGEKAVPILAGLLLLTIVATLIAFVLVERQTGHQEQYLLRTAEQQVLAQQVGKFALEASRGNANSFAALRLYRDRYTELLTELKRGVPEQGLPPAPDSVDAELSEVEDRWLELRAYADEILVNENEILAIGDFISVINEFIPQLQEASDEVVRLLVASKAGQRQVYVAARQLMLAQRIENDVNRVLDGGAQTALAIDQFSRDAEVYGQVLQGMIDGSPELDIDRVASDEGQKLLGEVALLFNSVSDHAGEIVDTIPAVLPALQAVDEVSPSSDRLAIATDELIDAFRGIGGGMSAGLVSFGPTVVTLLGIAAVILLVVLGLVLLRTTRAAAEQAGFSNQRNQQAIRRLLDEMMDLADGDLTIEATVTEDITGAIADSVNQAVEEMRGLVTTINETSVRVSASAQETRATALHLSEASEHQRDQIINASGIVRRMSSTMDEVAARASDSVRIARESLDIASEVATRCVPRSRVWTTSASRSRKPRNVSSGLANLRKRSETSLS